MRIDRGRCGGVLTAVLFGVAMALLLWQPALAQDVGDGSTTPLDSLSDFALWSLLTGALTSPLTAVINRTRWRSATKFGLFVGLCLAVAAGNAYFNRTLDLDNWMRSLLLVAAGGWGIYYAAKPAIKEIEDRTG